LRREEHRKGRRDVNVAGTGHAILARNNRRLDRSFHVQHDQLRRIDYAYSFTPLDITNTFTRWAPATSASCCSGQRHSPASPHPSTPPSDVFACHNLTPRDGSSRAANGPSAPQPPAKPRNPSPKNPSPKNLSLSLRQPRITASSPQKSTLCSASPRTFKSLPRANQTRATNSKPHAACSAPTSPPQRGAPLSVRKRSTSTS
jgi:hypothetical protein